MGRGERRREDQQAETTVSTSAWKASERGTEGAKICGRAGVGVSTEGELRTLRDFLKLPVTSQPPKSCPRAFYRHLKASDSDLIRMLIQIELFID